MLQCVKFLQLTSEDFRVLCDLRSIVKTQVVLSTFPGECSLDVLVMPKKPKLILIAGHMIIQSLPKSLPILHTAIRSLDFLLGADRKSRPSLPCQFLALQPIHKIILDLRESLRKTTRGRPTEVFQWGC